MITNVIDRVYVYVPEGESVMLATASDVHSLTVLCTLCMVICGLAVLFSLFWLHRMAKVLAEVTERLDDKELGEELERLGLW